jgi:hypothetical protein
MLREVFRYSFPSEVALNDVVSTMELAVLAVGSLHGDAQVRLDIRHFLDRAKRKCLVDATSQVGRDFNRIFAGFLMEEYGADGFEVERVEKAWYAARRGGDRHAGLD